MPRENMVEFLSHPQDLLGVDLNVGSLPLKPTNRLVNQDPCMGQCGALPLGPCCQEQGSDTGTLPIQIIEMGGFRYS